jgi:hypothetical protein
VTRARGGKARREFSGFLAGGGGTQFSCSRGAAGGEPEEPVELALVGDRVAYSVFAPPTVCSMGTQEQRVVVRDLGSGNADPAPGLVIAHAPTSPQGLAFDLLQSAGRYVAWVEPPNVIVVYDLGAGGEVLRQPAPASTRVTALRIDELGTIAFTYFPEGGGGAATGWATVADPHVRPLGAGGLLALGPGAVLLTRGLAGGGTELVSAPLSGDPPARVASFTGHVKRAGDAGVDASRIAWARSRSKIVRCKPKRSRKCRKHKFVRVVKYDVLTR